MPLLTGHSMGWFYGSWWATGAEVSPREAEWDDPGQACYPGATRETCASGATPWLSPQFFFKYVFIWLHQVLVEACKIFSCSMWTLSWGMWYLVPRPRIEPRLPALGVWSHSCWTTSKVPVPFFHFSVWKNLAFGIKEHLGVLIPMLWIQSLFPTPRRG